MKKLFFIALGLVAVKAQAVGLHDMRCINAMSCLTGKCEHTQGRDAKLKYVESGYDADVRVSSEEAIKIIYNDISKKLGLRIPDTIITHASPSDMSALAMVGGHPAPDFRDGQKVMEGAIGAAGILEFVTPGKEVSHQYVRDTNDFHERILVYAHVAGHYDFGETTRLFKMRDANQMMDSLKLAERMSEIRQQVSPVEVSKFYGQLQTLGWLQDLSRGSHQSVDSFRPENNRKADFIPQSPTEAIFQVFVANMRSDIEPWKREIAELYEKVHRVTGAYTQTKFMNEGWATMMEYIVIRHSPWNNSSHATSFAQINAGVAFPKLDNPYWLGLEAWRNLYNRFIDRPEVKSMSELDKDKHFIAYAHKIIEGHTDYTFLRMAFDERWTTRHDLILARPEQQVDTRTGETTNYRRIITREGQRVADWIANSLVNADLKFPKIEVVDVNYKKTGVILLRHNVVSGIPLLPATLAPSLYNLAQFSESKVKIETIASAAWGLYPGHETNDPFVYEKMNLEVSPDGNVTVEIPGATPEAIKIAQTFFKYTIDSYIQDLTITYPPTEKELRMANRAESIYAEAPNVANSIKRHAPTAPQAILEYIKMIKQRFEEILSLSVQGKSKVKFVGNKAQIKLYPDDPMIMLDRRILQMRKQKLLTPVPSLLQQMKNAYPHLNISVTPIKPPVTPVELGFKLRAEVMNDEDLILDQRRGRIGDIYDPKGEGQGQGQGEGKGKPEPGDEEGKPQPTEPGFEDIPIEVYGEALALQIQFRNMRHTSGQNEMMDDVRFGSEKRTFGQEVDDKTALEAFAVGKAMEIVRRKKNPNAKPKSAFELLKEGFTYLPDDQHVMKAWDREPQPDYDVVVVFVADTSGSVTEEMRNHQRTVVKNEVALLRARFKKVAMHFVIYSDHAEEVSEKDFFTKQLGGMTDASTGIELTDEILKKYPKAKFNRVVQHFSDGDDNVNPPKSYASAKDLIRTVDYLAYGHVGPREGDLSQMYKGLEKENPNRVGYAVITEDPQSIFAAIKHWFGKR